MCTVAPITQVNTRNGITKILAHIQSALMMLGSCRHPNARLAAVAAAKNPTMIRRSRGTPGADFSGGVKRIILDHQT